MADQGLSNIKGVSEEDRAMIENIEAMMGPEPEDMGFIKNAFWGRFREDLVFPYPQESDEEREKCDALLEELEEYLENEHPRVEIDREQYIPQSVIDRLFDMGSQASRASSANSAGVTLPARMLIRSSSAASTTASASPSPEMWTVLRTALRIVLRRWVNTARRNPMKKSSLGTSYSGSRGVVRTTALSTAGGGENASGGTVTTTSTSA